MKIHQSDAAGKVGQPEVPTPVAGGSPKDVWLRWLAVLALVYLLLVAVGAIGDGFKAVAGDEAQELFAFATNPIIALMVGMVATALTQSSSTVTSVTVGLVAGGLPLSIAIPMVMGANIGTSLTSTLVSLGHIRDGEEFRRAFAASTVHDCFNVLAVMILLPIEMLFSPLERMAASLAYVLRGDASLSMGGLNLMKEILAPGGAVLEFLLSWLPGAWAGLAFIVVGTGLILFVVHALGRVLRKLMVGRAKDVLHSAVGRGPLSGILSGGIVTIAVQSSSTTTALIVPLAGSGTISLKQVYPFTLGTNIGTTVTALLAATAITGPTATVALQIALVHLLFNLFGILLIFGIPVLRSLPLSAATGLATHGQRNKLWVFAYISGLFFALPLAVLGVSQLFTV